VRTGAVCVRMLPDGAGWSVTYAWHSVARCFDPLSCALPHTALFRLVCRHYGVCQGCGMWEQLAAPADGYGGSTGAGCCMRCAADLAFEMAWLRQAAAAETVGGVREN
jgi:hypothetical protein